MAKSSGRTGFGRGSSRGTVTVIEDRVQRSYKRTAKIAFWVITVVCGLLAAAVAASYTHPIVALLLGAVIGIAIAAPIAAFIVAWPILRVIWWWLPETLTAATVVYAFTALAQHTPLPIRLIVVVLVAAPAALPQVRHHVMRVVWCVISRHRLRACFNEFIITNRTGSLPFMLWATPTPVGERLWIWLRPGLSLDALQSRLEQIAVACWASTVIAEPASDRNAAYVRVDIKRRDALTGTVVSPLLDGIDTVPAPVQDRIPETVDGDALDLTDVTPESVTDTTKATSKVSRDRRDTKPATVPAGRADDVPDWI